jgi:hypothetical protein
MNNGEFEMVAISEIYKAVSVFSVSSTGLVTQTPNVSFVFKLFGSGYTPVRKFYKMCLVNSQPS